MKHGERQTASAGKGRFNPWFFAALLPVALVMRVATFGDPNLHVDESFYQTVGIAMHHGVIPYVDVWDRKPWGLFFLYYLIAFISYSPLAYQLVATMFATATAWVIGRIATIWTTARGGLFAGIVYLLWLNDLHGFGGQAPVFYNLFIAIAALLVMHALERLRQGETSWTVPLAMLLAGLAITIKPTALFESCFLGVYATAMILRSPLPRRRACAHIVGWALIGAAPMLAISAWYALHGYWSIYVQAMLFSSADRPMFLYPSTMRLLVTFIILAPVLVTAVMSLATWQGESRRFISWWLLAAVLGLLSVPNFYMHYSLPLLVPLCLASAVFLARPIAGPLALICLAIIIVRTTDSFEFARTRQSIAAFAELTASVRRHDDGSPLFIVDGPPQLYTMAGRKWPTPLIFPHHLGDENEKDLSHLSTLGETKRVLALKPGIIVTPSKPREGPPNMEVLNLVYAYMKANCRRVTHVETPDLLDTAYMDVWVDCRRKR